MTIKIKNQLKTDIARNRRIIKYIVNQYTEEERFNLPQKIDKFIAALSTDISKAEAWLRSTGQL